MSTRAWSQPRPRWRWLSLYLAPASITLLAFGLYLHGLESKGLWFDELGTLTGAGWGAGIAEAIRRQLTIPVIPKPPLHYLLVRLFLALGNQVFLLRLPSALCATVNIPLAYALGRSMFGRRTGLLAAALLAISPLHLRYAQEARMYALLTLLALLSLYLFWRAVTSDRGRWWAGFAVVAALALYTHFFALLTLGVMVLFALYLMVLSPDRSRFPFRRWHFFLALVSTLLAFSPMLPSLGKGLLSREGLAGTAAAGWDLNAVFVALRLTSGGNSVGFVLCAGLLGLAVAVLATKDRQVLLLTILWLTLPVIIVLTVPFGHATRIRYFLFALPVYLLLVAFGLTVAGRWLVDGSSRLLKRTLHRLAIEPDAAGTVSTILLLTVLSGLAVPSVASYYAETKQNWLGATRVLSQEAEPGDPVFVRHVYHQTGVLYYAELVGKGDQAWTDEDVQVLPRDPSAAFPPENRKRGWLVVPLMDYYLTGGEFERKLQPHYRLGSPIIFPAPRAPKEAWIISPPAFRTVAVVPVLPFEPPSVRFWADHDSLSPGDCTWLRWEVDRVREVYLDGAGVAGHDQRRVCPNTGTRYELRVVEMDGSATLETVEISVSAP